MASFDKFEKKILKCEGNKFVVDPDDDDGGATNSGITLRTFRMIFGKDKTVEDLRNLTQAQWRQVYKGYFWDKCWGDMIKNQSVAEIFVDWCIHSGIDKIKLVQGMVDTTQDGIMGPKTLAAINAADQEILHRQIKLTRATRALNQIVSQPNRKYKYFDGWFNRFIYYKYSKY